MNYPLHIAIYYGSFLVFPLIAYGIFLLYHKKGPILFLVFLLILSSVFIYARFIERYMIIVRHETLDLSKREKPDKGTRNSKEKLKIAVVSDLHLGVYKDDKFLEKIVQKINEQNPDLIVIPGDFIYKITPQQFSYFNPLTHLNAPVYAVTGNHDAKKPGEYSSSQVRKYLSPYLPNMIDNKKIDIPFLKKNGIRVQIIGLSDLWEGVTDYTLLKTKNRNFISNPLTIVLTHNPDTALNLPNEANIDLVIAGHTHGGQIRLPFIYKWVIPTQYDFDRGWYDVFGRKVYVTSGAGEVGLPMRFLVPPEVVIIDIQL